MTIDAEKKYPIAEIFTSWQGEGLWSGTRMTFIRFAGCNVGKPIKEDYPDDERIEGRKFSNTYGNLPIWQEECTSWDGRKFLCDTDFRVKERLTAKEILEKVPEGIIHLCFTGGEPLLHAQGIDYIRDLWMEKVKWSERDEKIFHIETSGTIIYDWAEHRSNWITVSPKLNYKKEMIQRANELKLLVDENFDEKKAEELIKDTTGIIWLSSINGIKDIDEENSIRCQLIASRHPTWRLTNQNQKIWGVR